MKPKRFVIQQHTQGPETHWDLMLESGDSLMTWRLPLPPSRVPSGPVGAVKIADHPQKFLTYQGPVNKGKGAVTIADQGTYEMTTDSPDTLRLHLAGRILKGPFTLKKHDSNTWFFHLTTGLQTT